MRFKRSGQSSTPIYVSQSVYSSCSDLPLYNFIEISITGDLDRWGVNEKSWESIIAEYTELSGNSSISKMFGLRRQITYLTNKLNIIQYIINALTLKRNDQLIQLLQKEYGFNKLTFDDLFKDLQRVVSLSKGEIIKLKLAQKQFNDLQKDAPTETMSRFDWDNNLRDLGKYQGYPIKKKETTVSEYLAIDKGYKEHIEYLKKQNGRQQ